MLTFVTDNNAPFGTLNVFNIVSNDICANDLSPLNIYKIGDINMDGLINVRDLNLFRQVMLNMTTLNDMQKMYSNVYADYEQDGNAKFNVRDLNAIRQLMLGKISRAGDRISVTFVNADDIQKVISMQKGSALDTKYLPEEGFVWSLSNTEYVSVDFSALDKDTIVYLMNEN